MPPVPGAWRLGAALQGTKLTVEHMSLDGATLYRHVQDLVLADLALFASRGLVTGLAVEAMLPLRLVEGDIAYQDLARQPYSPMKPDLHHRDETLAGTGDPEVALLVGRAGGPWSLAARAGLAIPLGRTEENPFELGRQGIRHQHVQFGTGTWDPVLGLGAGRAVGPVGVDALAGTRLVLAENAHGYRSGHRHHAALRAHRAIGAVWTGHAGFSWAREETERWNGQVEEEGNLGRTDLLLDLGLGRSLGAWGGARLALRLPLVTRSNGQQIDFPAVLALSWSR